MLPVIHYKGYKITYNGRGLFTISKDGETISHEISLKTAKHIINQKIIYDKAIDATNKLSKSISNLGLTFGNLQEPNQDNGN